MKYTETCVTLLKTMNSMKTNPSLAYLLKIACKIVYSVKSYDKNKIRDFNSKSMEKIQLGLNLF